MGSRYGRNQKRKYREAIRFREAELNRLSNKYSKLISETEHWNDEIMHIIRQRYSSFSKDIQSIAVRYFHELQYIDAPVSLASIMDCQIRDYSTTPNSYNPIRLVRFLCELSEEQLTDFRRIITLKISNGKQLAYAINEEDLHLMKNDPKFKHFLSQEIAREFSVML